MDDLFDAQDLGFDFSGDLMGSEARKQTKGERGIVSHRGGERHFERKATSDLALSQALGWHFEEGDCYHCFSFGDVDMVSYLKHVMRQEHVSYLACATWVVSGTDVRDFMEWNRLGYIDRIDMFVGEIVEGSYPDTWADLKALRDQCGGRLVKFRNHAKVMAIKGDEFDCLIESSANFNTNPRSEDTVLTVGTELVDWYIELLGGVDPFNLEPGADPYRVGGEAEE